MAYISSKQDSVTSVALGGPAFELQLLEAVSELNSAHPERFQGLIDNGDAHTYIIRSFNLEIGDISVRQWVRELINESEDWESVIE